MDKASMKQHSPRFTTSSSRGPILSCECGWQMMMVDVVISPLTTDVHHSFFRAGFDMGQAFQRHLHEEATKA